MLSHRPDPDLGDHWQSTSPRDLQTGLSPPAARLRRLGLWLTVLAIVVGLIGAWLVVFAVIRHLQ